MKFLHMEINQQLCEDNWLISCNFSKMGLQFLAAEELRSRLELHRGICLCSWQFASDMS
jgi:hypothetical protein